VQAALLLALPQQALDVGPDIDEKPRLAEQSQTGRCRRPGASPGFGSNCTALTKHYP
jgi:hypothetical protein